MAISSSISPSKLKSILKKSPNSSQIKKQVKFKFDSASESNVSKIELPSNITPKLAKQLESIRTLAKARMKISHNASKSNQREMSIRCKTSKVIRPFETDRVEIKFAGKPKMANYYLHPTKKTRKNGPLTRLHLPDSIINSETRFVYLTNTSSEPIKILEETRIGAAVELTAYDVPVADEGDLNIDTIFTCDTSEIKDDYYEEINHVFSIKPEQIINQSIVDMSHKDDSPDTFDAKLKSDKQQSSYTNKEEKTIEYQKKLKTYEPDVIKLLDSFRPVFIPKTDWGHPHMKGEGRRLPQKHDKIVPTKPPAKRRYTKRDEDAIDNFIDTSLRSGLISPIESPTTSALHVVYKDGKPRIVSDLRAINATNAGDFNYVFPRPTDRIREVTGKGYTVFSSLDMSGAFTQIPVHEDSKPLLAFTAMTKKHAGTFAYNFLNFGFKCSPAIFSAELDKILEGVNTTDIDGCVVNYFDDILVASVDKETHKVIISRLLTRFLQFGVTLNLAKSNFFSDSAEFCSYKVTSRGYRFSDKRLRLLKDYPDYDVSQKKKNSDLKILGFYNYHRPFVKDYAKYERKIRDTVKEWKLGNKKPEDTEKANKIIKQCTDHIKREVAQTSLESVSDGDTVHLFTDASKDSYGY